MRSVSVFTSLINMLNVKINDSTLSCSLIHCKYVKFVVLLIDRVQYFTTNYLATDSILHEYLYSSYYNNYRITK